MSLFPKKVEYPFKEVVMYSQTVITITKEADQDLNGS